MQRGFTLLESLISLGVVVILVVILVALVSARGLNRNTAYQAQAAMLANEEITALRQLGFSSLSDQSTCSIPTDCPFRNVLYNAGSWDVVADATNPTGHSVPHVLTLEGASTLAGTNSGVLQLPDALYGDVTVEANWYVAPDSVSGNDPDVGWSIGYLVRAADARSLYRLRIGEYEPSGITTDYDSGKVGIQNVVIEKIQNGSVSVLGSTNATVVKGMWYSIEFAVSGSAPASFSVTMNGGASPILTASDSSAVYASGAAALAGWNGVHAEVDDVLITSASTQSWDFDTPSEPTMPAAWVRLGLNDLPDATPGVFNDNGSVVIEPYPDATSTSLKRATVTITWVQNGTERTYTATTLIGRNGFGS